MSVPGVTKCPRVQTFLVIGVAITLVTSYWRRLVLFPSCSVSSQQLDAINPALLLPPSYKEGRECGHSPTKVPLFTENPSRVLLGNRASGIRASRKPSFVLCRYVRTAQFVDYTGLSIRPTGIVWLARRRVTRCIKSHRFLYIFRFPRKVLFLDTDLPLSLDIDIN